MEGRRPAWPEGVDADSWMAERATLRQLYYDSTMLDPKKRPTAEHLMHRLLSLAPL